MDNMELTETVTTPMQSNCLDELGAALAKAQGELTGAKKDSKNPFFKSNYADLASIHDAIRESFSKHGLSYIQTTEEDGILITTLLHSSGQWIRGRLKIDAVKKDPQGIGSAITYARRYALAAIAGVAQIDDDAESAMNRITQDPVDMAKVNKAANYFREQINSPDDVEASRNIKKAWAKLNNNERMEVNNLLKDKPAHRDKMYKGLLKDFLNMPEELHSTSL